MGFPSSRIASSAGRVRSPLSRAASSACPLPETPAMPTISPAWTASETSARSVPKGSSASASRSRNSRRGVGSGRAGSRWVSGSAEPTISAASFAGEVVLGSAVPATAPARRIVAVSQRSRISSSLWLM